MYVLCNLFMCKDYVKCTFCVLTHLECTSLEYVPCPWISKEFFFFSIKPKMNIMQLQWRRKGMVRESKVLHKNPETSYVEEGFSGIKTQLWSWPAGTKLMKIRGFQKCKIHSCSLNGFRITACQSWCIFGPAAIWLLLDAGISNCYCYTGMYFTFLETSNLH